MSKRQLSLSDDEETIPKEAPTKMIKRAQTENLEQNMLNRSSKNKQTQLTSFFTNNSTNAKAIRTDEEEQKIQIESKGTANTEILIETDSDVSYHRFSLNPNLVVNNIIK